ncbi:MAG: hypothetical protein SNJ64_03280 [Endomicrobiia bacterium]
MNNDIKVLNWPNTTTASNILNFDDISIFEKEFEGYGKFKLRIPTLFEDMKINIAIKKQLEKQELSLEERSLVEAIITLENVIIEKPKDFAISMIECRDIELIMLLWNWCLECYKEYSEGIKKKKMNLMK